MTNNKQSSVEKMFQEMIEIQQSGKKLTFDENLALLEKYKAMHKEEIMQAHFAPKYGCFSEQYYNETYVDKNN
jgi:hypothetical protein